MKVLKYCLLLICISITVVMCKKDDDDDNNNNNNNTVNWCDSSPCRNGAACDSTLRTCTCTSDWQGEFCDTSSKLFDFYKSYQVFSSCNGAELKNELFVLFSQPEKATNPDSARFKLSIACDYGDDNVVILPTTFDGMNFTTASRQCIYNSVVASTYRASGYFTNDSLFFTIYATFNNKPAETCDYAGKRP